MKKNREHKEFIKEYGKQIMLRAGGIVVAFAVLLSCVNLAALPVSAADSVSADFLSYYDLNIQDGIVTGYTLKPAYNILDVPGDLSLVIPSDVTGIGDNAFDRCNLTSVTIPTGVTRIGDYAFANCRFTSVTIPDSVTSIGYFAFEYCPLLSITVPSSVTTSTAAFESCEDLTSVTLASGTTQVGDNEFDGCTNLADITIPDTVTSIGNFSFSSCPITSITIPSSVSTIESAAFENCTKLKSINLPGVTSIEGDAFSGCSSLTSVGFSSELKYIGFQAFADCPSLESVTIPSSVTDVDYEAFDGSGLASITFESATTTIGEGQSGYNDNTGVTLPSGAVIYGYDPSTAKDYAAEYARTFKPIENAPAVLESIAVTSPPDKTSYMVGDPLDLTGLVVTGTYSDGSTKTEPIAVSDISGYDCSKPVASETLTITYDGITASFPIQINPDLQLVLAKDNNAFQNEDIDFFKSSYDSQKRKYVFTEPENYTLSQPRFDQLVAHQSKEMKNSLQNFINKSNNWGGSCFGISATMILAKLKDINLSNFDASAQDYYQLQKPAVNTNVRDLINYYYLAQFLPCDKNATIYAMNPSKITGLPGFVTHAAQNAEDTKAVFEKIVEKAKGVLSGDAPFILDLGWLQGGSVDYHAVVCNGYLPEANGDYDLQIVDPDVTTGYQTLTIAKNYSSYQFNDGYYKVDANNWIGIGYLDVNAMDSINIDKSNQISGPDTDGGSSDENLTGTAMYITDPESYSIKDAAGNQLSWADDGSLSGTLTPDSITPVSDGGSGTVCIGLPQTGSYTVTPKQASMDISAVDNNSFASVNETGAADMVFKSNNAVDIDGGSFSYTASVPDPQSEGNIQIGSSNGANVSISQCTQGVIVRSSNLQNLTIQTIREPDSENTTQTVSTTKDSILIEDKAGDSTGAVEVLVSSKNDGNYDQEIDAANVSPASTNSAAAGSQNSSNSGIISSQSSSNPSTASSQNSSSYGAAGSQSSSNSGIISSQSNSNPSTTSSQNSSNSGNGDHQNVTVNDKNRNPNTGDDKMSLTAMLLSIFLIGIVIPTATVSLRLRKKR